MGVLILWLKENHTVNGQIHQQNHSYSDGAYSTKCTSIQLANIIKARPNFNSHCPDRTNWMNIVLNESKTNKKATIVVIGCNKGDDFISQLGAWSGNSTYDPVKYVEILQKKHQPLTFVCGSAKRIAFEQESRPIKAYCIEPLDVNFELIEGMIHKMHFDTSYVKVLPLAISAYPDVALFPKSGQAGIEHVGLGSATKKQKIKKHWFAKPTIPKNFVLGLINVTNIDTFVVEEKIDKIDFLSIDTEGYDGMVILGMAKTLSKGQIRVFEFEYHLNPPWNKMVNVDNRNLVILFFCYLLQTLSFVSMRFLILHFNFSRICQ